jgi:hypothetical protein
MTYDTNHWDRRLAPNGRIEDLDLLYGFDCFR